MSFVLGLRPIAAEWQLMGEKYIEPEIRMF